MAKVTVKLSGQHKAADISSSLATQGTKPYLPTFLRTLGEALGPFGATASVQVMNSNAVAASGLITIVDNTKVGDGDTYKVGTLTLTAKAAGAGNNQFNIGLTATATAKNMATAVGAYSSGVFTASNSAGAVTITCNTAGTLGNSIPILVTQADVGTSSDAALTGGLEDTGTTKDYKAF